MKIACMLSISKKGLKIKLVVLDRIMCRFHGDLTSQRADFQPKAVSISYTRNSFIGNFKALNINISYSYLNIFLFIF